MLRQLLSLLAICLVVNASTFTNDQTSEKQQVICEQKLSNKCITNERFQRSIEQPISSFFKRLFGQDKETNDITVVRCDKGLVIKVVESEVSNVDKSKCTTTKGQGKTDNCTDKLLTTILLTKKCQEQSECSISVSKDLANFCPCSSQKYLDLKYTCVKPEDANEEIKSISKRYLRTNFQLKPEGVQVKPRGSAQRTLRRVCRDCDRAHPVDDDDFDDCIDQRTNGRSIGADCEHIDF